MPRGIFYYGVVGDSEHESVKPETIQLLISP